MNEKQIKQALFIKLYNVVVNGVSHLPTCNPQNTIEEKKEKKKEIQLQDDTHRMKSFFKTFFKKVGKLLFLDAYICHKYKNSWA